MNTIHPSFFISMYVCCCALWLLFVTMICLGTRFVQGKTNHPGFVFPCMCVLWCSAAAVCRRDLFWLPFCFIYKPARVFVFPCMCVVVLYGCCLPSWFVLAPFLLYQLQVTQGSYFHSCRLLCSVAAVPHPDLCWLVLFSVSYNIHIFLNFHVFVCCVLCSCCLPPWFALAPFLFHRIQITQVSYLHICVCCGGLCLRFATMICFGSFFVPSNLEAFEKSCWKPVKTIWTFSFLVLVWPRGLFKVFSLLGFIVWLGGRWGWDSLSQGPWKSKFGGLQKSIWKPVKKMELLAFRCFCGSGAFSSFSFG